MISMKVPVGPAASPSISSRTPQSSAGPIHRQSRLSSAAREAQLLSSDMTIAIAFNEAIADTPRSKRHRHTTAAVSHSEEVCHVAEETCPICLETVVEDGGRMPCCEKLLHKACAVAWRRSNQNEKNVKVNRSGKELDPDTRRCVWCKTIGNGACSSRRMFSSEP